MQAAEAAFSKVVFQCLIDYSHKLQAERVARSLGPTEGCLSQLTARFLRRIEASHRSRVQSLPCDESAGEVEASLAKLYRSL